jgi:hypothetical protein
MVDSQSIPPMSEREPTPLTLAVRVYSEPEQSEKDFDRPRREWNLPNAMFVFDTETTTDHTQRLTFGSYRFIVAGQCLKEGIFYADDLPAKDRRVLQRYVDTHSADVVPEGLAELSLLSRAELVKEFYRDAYKARCLVVGFNLPFDLSRIACDFTDARKRFAGGFSLGLWSYVDKTGREQRHPRRPRLAIKHIDSKRSLKGFTDRSETDDVDRIPEGSITGKPEDDYIFRGHFLDLRTLAFALTDRGYSLEDACKAFGVKHGKQRVERHGIVTEQYIDYNRRDVLATSELAFKLLEEYEKHPIASAPNALQPTKAYSPASIGKAYLRKMGIAPILERQPKFPKKYLGYAQSAFYGGRTSAHIRKVAMPVVYTDFLSMYPTVNGLMDLWSFVTAKKIEVIEKCGDDIETVLRNVIHDPNILFQPGTWKQLTAYVRVMPDGDALPTRARYSSASNDWQVAVNYLYADRTDLSQALWFSLPDVVASVLLTGRQPEIVDAFWIKPVGKIRALNPIKLRGTIEVDPRQQDFFRVAIEERKRLSGCTDLNPEEKARLDKALKVLANAASYGIYAEMHRLESDKKVQVTCHGIDADPFRPWVKHPDEPGAYCFPPLSSLITGAARLMLALLEHSVVTRGGTYVMEDTDSMAIVATEKGGAIARPGGPHTHNGAEAVRALSWEQVREVRRQFEALNPYNREAVPGSILKIEDDNRDPKTGEQRQIYCYAISAKRYALFIEDRDGKPVLLRTQKNNHEDRWSEHGLGHLLNPVDPESEDRDWIAQAWLRMIRKSKNLPTSPLSVESVPAVGRVTVSSPAVMRPLEALNKEQAYCEQIKPFNLLLSCHVVPLGHPPKVNPEKFQLISPYETDSHQWLKKVWIDKYSCREYRITTAGQHGDRRTARVKTYGDVLEEYEYHPEAKCAEANGKICDRQTIGLLERRHVWIDQIKYIGKESNSLEEVESGLEHSQQSVYTEYPDPKRDEWETKIRPALRAASLADLVRKCKGEISRRALIELRAGRTRPHRKNQEMLKTILNKMKLL